MTDAAAGYSPAMARVAVIGGGAAGMMAAAFAAAGGAETLLLEHTPDGGRKILISGGGRCNILPAHLDETRFVTDSSPHTLRNIVRSWPLHEQRAFFEQVLGQPLVEEVESAKLFPASQRARDVRDGLLAHAVARGARWMPSTTVSGLTRAGDRWRIGCKDARTLDADRVIVATGGLSVPKTGSDGRGLALLAELGHIIHEPYAALTPVNAEPAPFAALAGVSLTVSLVARDAERSARARGGFLFTHRGYSGPAVLDVSHVLVRSSGGARLIAQWTALDAEGWERALRGDGARGVVGVVRGEMPARLADLLVHQAGIDPETKLSQLRRADRVRLVEGLTRCELPWTGHGGYAKAEVTGGGVSLAEIDPRTMESRKVPGLYVCGEALDAFGPIGGYNFLWAWATGRAAGLAAARGN
ncbi:MAG TPA: aminoacetone oxidase family FAD-binding enzyme [Gemmatimonadales bacterium]